MRSKPIRNYRDKRDPVGTPEPFAPSQPAPAATLLGRFVVHRHSATREHYDLRLEIGGALKSFAVPKGPSLDPDEKRLAVNTEDHPLEYLDFEDVIPDGNYGAGPMIVWDRGRVRYLEGSAEEGILRGKIDFELSGFKLGGRFALVHTGARRGPTEQNQWLLIKKADARADASVDVLAADPRSVISGLTVEELSRLSELKAELSETAAQLGAPVADLDARTLTPMACALEGASLDDPQRLYELKLDGARIVAARHGGGVVLRYRNGRICTQTFPEIARAVAKLPADRCVLDGEIVAFDEQGRPRFQRLQPRLVTVRPEELARVAAEVPVAYLVFDVLALGDRSLTRLPLLSRKAILAQLVRGKGLVRALDHLQGHGRVLYDFCRAEGLEGVVSKRADSPYREGPSRSTDWVKLKCERDDEFVVVGWDEGRGARKALGALRLASYEGDELVLRGKVGSGLDRAVLNALDARLRAAEIPECAARGELAPGRGPVHHVRPEVVVSVRFIGWTDDGHLREPVFRGLRDDLPPAACSAAPPGGERLDPASLPEAVATSARVALTNRDKVFWPDQGYTKGHLLDYYASVAPALLPFLAERPVILVRYPDGINGKNFYQWRPPEAAPDWLRALELRDDEDREARGDKSVFLVDSLDALLYIVNLGCIPLHVLASRAGDLDCGDFFTIDFDIGDGSFRDAIVLMLALEQLLSEAGLRGFPKTSGQTGLHVLVPVGPHVPFAVTKGLAELFGRLLEAAHPKLATTERRVDKRGPRVFIDIGQTGRSRAIVAPYSVRAVPGATVSTPLSWEEVNLALDPRRFDIVTVPARLAERGDPLAELSSERPDVGLALERLGQRLGQS
ncbi:MAG: DNA ligase D [Myxococcales bacterium]|nr:DNA ligase D [Myxococcales bacterium]